MKRKLLPVLVILCITLYVIESCQKNSGTSTSSESLAAAISSLQAIAVGSTSSSASALDSIYVINTCSSNSTKDTIAFNSLPSAVTDYLAANYAGYTAQKAFTVADSSGTPAGYIVIIQYNNGPVGLKFDASGNFVTVLQQKLGRDLEGCLYGDTTHNHHEDSTSGH
jgi:hypothetical protein